MSNPPNLAKKKKLARKVRAQIEYMSLYCCAACPKARQAVLRDKELRDAELLRRAALGQGSCEQAVDLPGAVAHRLGPT